MLVDDEVCVCVENVNVNVVTDVSVIIYTCFMNGGIKVFMSE